VKLMAFCADGPSMSLIVEPSAIAQPLETDLAAAVMLLAEASRSQSESMLSLARSTAESVRLAAGTYVFQLRDRFDELLPAVQVGASESAWAIADDEACADDEAWEQIRELPDAVTHLVFHPGDTATANLRVGLSQAPVRRLVRVFWQRVPDNCGAGPIDINAAILHRDRDGSVHLDSDVSLFIDAPLLVQVGDAELGALETNGVLIVEVSDPRPEGAVSRTEVNVALAAQVIPDEDGVALEVPTISCWVSPERRTYWLDKAEQLPLQLPRLG
jgi:hypothetical protein